MDRGQSRRFSDEELHQFRQQFIDHVEQFGQHEEDERAKYDCLLETLNANTAAINRTEESTKDMVAAWEAAQGAVKVAAAMGTLFKFLAGLAFVGGFFTWLASHGPK